MSYKDKIADPSVVWHMNLFKIGRYNCIAIIHDTTLYNLVKIGLKKQDFMNIDGVLRKTLHLNLIAEGFDQEVVEKFMKPEEEMVFTKTHNRSTLGCLKEVIDTIQFSYPTEKAIMNEDPININRYNKPFSIFET